MNDYNIIKSGAVLFDFGVVDEFVVDSFGGVG